MNVWDYMLSVKHLNPLMLMFSISFTAENRTVDVFMYIYVDESQGQDRVHELLRKCYHGQDQAYKCGMCFDCRFVEMITHSIMHSIDLRASDGD